MKVQWSEHALEQVEQIFAYIVRDRPNVAVDIVDGLFDTAEQLSETPEMGPPWPPAQRQDLRFILFKTYRILYRVDEDRVIVTSVRHTRRDTDATAD